MPAPEHDHSNQSLLIDLAILEYFLHQNIYLRLYESSSLYSCRRAYSYALHINELLTSFKHYFGDNSLPFDFQIKQRLALAKIIGLAFFNIGLACFSRSVEPPGINGPCCQSHQLEGLSKSLLIIENMISTFPYKLVSIFPAIVSIKSHLSIQTEDYFHQHFPENDTKPKGFPDDLAQMLSFRREEILNSKNHGHDLNEKYTFQPSLLLTSLKAIYETIEPPLVIRSLKISRCHIYQGNTTPFAVNVIEKFPPLNNEVTKGATSAMCANELNVSEHENLENPRKDSSVILSKSIISDLSPTTVTKPSPLSAKLPNAQNTISQVALRNFIPVEIVADSETLQLRQIFGRWCVHHAAESYEIRLALEQSHENIRAEWEGIKSLQKYSQDKSFEANDDTIMHAEVNVNANLKGIIENSSSVSLPPLDLPLLSESPSISGISSDQYLTLKKKKRCLLDRHDSAKKIATPDDSRFNLSSTSSESHLSTPVKLSLLNVTNINHSASNLPVRISTTARRKRPWSAEEEVNLEQGIRRFGKRWSLILTTFSFNDRTQVDLKDKARNMVKAGRLRDIIL